MPKLTKVRMVNIQLDEGKKVIPDNTWTPNAKDTIFLLENGGGKTSFIQLVTQTILPRSRMSGRELKKVVGYNTTGHILTEWLLDGDNLPHQYLCLGFTFMNGSGPKDDLTSFNYMFTYNIKDELTIDTIPVKDNGRVTKYSDHRSFLRDNNLRPFDVIKSYKKELKRYHILAEEWELIQKVNGEEGGVDKFFEKASTTSDLLVKLLIPQVEDTIFDTQEKKKEIQQYFSEYSKNLLSIPDIKRDLSDFQVIRDYAEDLVGAVEMFEEQKNNFIKAQQKVIQVKETLRLEVQKTKDELEKIGVQLEELTKQQKDNRWKAESYPIHELIQKEEQTTTELTTSESELKTLKEELNGLEYRAKHFEAFKHYGEYQEYTKKINQINTRLEILSNKNIDLEKERDEAKRLLNESWVYIKEEYQEQCKIFESEVAEARALFQNRKNELARFRNEEKEARNLHLKAENEYNNFAEEKEEVAREIDEEAAITPKVVLSRYQDRQSQLLEQIKSDEREITDKQEQISKTELEVFQKQSQIEKVQGDIENLNDALSQYDVQMNQLKERCIEENVDWEDRDHIITQLQHEKVNRESEKEKRSSVVHDLEQEINFLSSYDYFVPDQTLIRVQRHLEVKGIVSMLGSEWLSELPNDELKSKYLAAHPLLPYTLLIEEPQRALIKQALSSIKGSSLNIPILFYVKNNLSPNGEVGTNKLFSVQEGLWAYQDIGIDWFLNKSKIDEKIQELQSEKKQAKNQYDYIKAQYEKTSQLLSDVKVHFGKFPSYFVAITQKEVDSRKSSIVELQATIHEGRDLIKNNNSIIEQLKMRLEDSRNETGQLYPYINFLARFVDRYPNPAELKQVYEQKKIEAKQYETKIEECEIERETLEVVLEEKKDHLNSHKRDMEVHSQLKRQHKLSDDVELTGAYGLMDMYNYEIRFIELDKKYSNEEGVRHQLKERFEDQMDNINKTRISIKELGFTVEYIQQDYKMYSDIEEKIASAKILVKERNAKIKKLESKITESQTVLKMTTEQKEAKINDIDGEFNKDPYEYPPFNPEEVYEQVLQLQQSVKRQKGKLQSSSDKLAFELKDMELAHRDIERNGHLPPYTESLGLLSASSIKEPNFEDYTIHVLNVLGRVTKDLSNYREKVYGAFDAYIGNVNQSHNPKVRRFTIGFGKLRVSEKLFEVEYIIQTFSRIFDTIKAMEDDLKLKIEECEKDKKKLVELCYHRIDLIHKNITEIPKYSKIELFGHELQLIKMQWKRDTEEEALINLHFYIESILKKLQAMKKEGLSEQEMNDYLLSQLDNIKLLEHLAPINKCKVTIYKPRKRSLMNTHYDNWKLWDEVADWSGGEEFSSYMSMFIMLITYLRKKTNAKDRASKTIIADNPFGKASSEHVVRPIIELAWKSNIQLFCLTAHKDEEIRTHFECVLSNRYYNQAGADVMQTETETKSVSIRSLSYEED